MTQFILQRKQNMKGGETRVVIEQEMESGELKEVFTQA